MKLHTCRNIKDWWCAEYSNHNSCLCLLIMHIWSCKLQFLLQNSVRSITRYLVLYVCPAIGQTKVHEANIKLWLNAVNWYCFFIRKKIRKNNWQVISGGQYVFILLIWRLIESMMVLRPRQGNLRQVFRLFKSHARLCWKRLWIIWKILL